MQVCLTGCSTACLASPRPTAQNMEKMHARLRDSDQFVRQCRTQLEEALARTAAAEAGLSRAHAKNVKLEALCRALQVMAA